VPANSTTQSIYGPITNSSVINIQAKPTRPKALNNIFLRVQSRLELLLIASELVVTMKNLLACLVMLATFCANAQVNDFQLPYNPDAQPDGYIGAADVVELLTYYGQEWNSNQLSVTANDDHVLMQVAEAVSYDHCLGLCANLSGSWRLATWTDRGRHLDTLSLTGAMWVQPITDHPDHQWSHFDYGGNFYSGFDDSGDQHQCWCATADRPKVEYSVCIGYGSGAWTEVEECGQLKVADGWYPLGSNDGASQAFWRWAE